MNSLADFNENWVMHYSVQLKEWEADLIWIKKE